MQQRPNLLYIHSDQHNPYVMGCAGDPVVETPHLDRLADEGVQCTQVYCPSPVCVASRMAMLAGRYPSDIEVWTNNQILDSGVPTMAHAMGAAGVPARADRPHALNRFRPTARLCRKAGRRSLLQLARRGPSTSHEPQQSRESRTGTEFVPSTRRGRDRRGRVLSKSDGSAEARRSYRRPLQPQHRLYAAAFSLFGAAALVRLLPSKNSPTHSARAFRRSPPPCNPLVAGPRRFARCT